MKSMYTGENYERHAAELCLRLALKKLEEENYELAAHRAEEAIRSIKELREIKKPTDAGTSIGNGY